MAIDLDKFAETNGVKYFMISFTDLFGGQRAKLVPARAIADMQKNGAGFAGFATWLDLTPAHPDMLAMPDSEAVIILPWNKEIAWVPGNCVMSGKTSIKPHVTYYENSSLKQHPKECMSKLELRLNSFC